MAKKEITTKTITPERLPKATVALTKGLLGIRVEHIEDENVTVRLDGIETIKTIDEFSTLQDLVNQAFETFVETANFKLCSCDCCCIPSEDGNEEELN